MYDLIVIVPYRDRIEHLQQFVPHLEKFLGNKRIKIVVVEQAGEQKFNRGKLLNVGYSICRDEADLFALHDVDMLPQDELCDYNADEDVVHLAGAVSQFNYILPYPTYLGGVVVLRKSTFESLNGYHNDYWGWGIEDDDFFARAKQARKNIARKNGKFESLKHAPAASSSANLRMWQSKNQNASRLLNGLTNLQFNVVKRSPLKDIVPCGEQHEHILVDIGEPSMDWVRHDIFVAFDPTEQGLHRAMNTRHECVIMVPAGYFIDPHCEQSLQELSRRGYHIKKCVGSIAIDKIRSQMATEALAAGFRETMWIDADVGFNPDDVDRLRAYDLPIIAGVYPKKTYNKPPEFSSKFRTDLPCGEIGGVLVADFAATGFLFVKSSVYDMVQKKYDMPICETKLEQQCIPYFLPMVVQDGESYYYLSEDYAFSFRVKECGQTIYVDTKIKLHHYGNYGYSWDDMAPRHRDVNSIFIKANFDATIKS